MIRGQAVSLCGEDDGAEIFITWQRVMIVTNSPVILIISVIGLMITIMHHKGFTKPVSHKLGCFLSDSFPPLSLKQTKRHQLSHGPAWLERSLSLCVLKCQLLQALDEPPWVPGHYSYNAACCGSGPEYRCWWQHGITTLVSSDAL